MGEAGDKAYLMWNEPRVTASKAIARISQIARARIAFLFAPGSGGLLFFFLQTFPPIIWLTAAVRNRYD
jgi:hypothetical protein